MLQHHKRTPDIEQIPNTSLGELRVLRKLFHNLDNETNLKQKTIENYYL